MNLNWNENDLKEIIENEPLANGNIIHKLDAITFIYQKLKGTQNIFFLELI